MGTARAAEKLLLGDPFTGAEAVECGIANAVLPAAEVVHHARRIAERFNALPPGAVRETKRLMRRGAPAGAAARRSASKAEVFGQRLRSPEAKEAFRPSSRSASPTSRSSDPGVRIGHPATALAAEGRARAAAGRAGAGDAAARPVLPEAAGARHGVVGAGEPPPLRLLDRRRLVGRRRRRRPPGAGGRRPSGAGAACARSERPVALGACARAPA